MNQKQIDQMMNDVQWEPLPVGESISSKETGLYATHQGWFGILGMRIKCYQLNNGERVFDADSVQQFFNSPSRN